MRSGRAAAQAFGQREMHLLFDAIELANALHPE
jgi:hypothetical protein